MAASRASLALLKLSSRLKALQCPSSACAGPRPLKEPQALGCLLSALQHRLPLSELLLPARLLVLEPLTLLQQWQLGIQHLQRSGRLRKVLLGLLLRLLFLLELLQRLSGLGFRLDGLIKLRTSSAFAASIGVAERPALRISCCSC